MTPTIQGLTERQKTIADLLWACQGIDSVNQLIKALPTEQDRRDAQSMVKIIVYECWEQEHGLDAYESQALEAIERARG